MKLYASPTVFITTLAPRIGEARARTVLMLYGHKLLARVRAGDAGAWPLIHAVARELRTLTA